MTGGKQTTDIQEVPRQDGEKTTILRSSQTKNQQCQLETLEMMGFMSETLDIPAIRLESVS